jgi:hypothetical protein
MDINRINLKFVDEFRTWLVNDARTKTGNNYKGDTAYKYFSSLGTALKKAKQYRQLFHNPFNDDDAPNNWVVLRYADVLLMLAESIGESDESYSYINEVRSRAGLASINSASPGSFSEKLLQERRVELAFENHRWPDLLRFNVAAAKMSANGRDIKGRLLYAIPQRELDLNSSWTQNPGY